MNQKTKIVVTRFAPSPTGYLHIGGARTALYNYLFAKKMGGKFILRIEDTDLERSTDASIQAILDGMEWLGLAWDEGPYFQTKRFDLYQNSIQTLIKMNKAYPCFCTPEILNAKRENVQAQKDKYRYDRTCYHLSEEARQEKIAAGTKYVIRFFSQDNQTIVVKDIIKGEVRVNTNELDDLILQRTDGSPTYNLTVVVDDALMGITHVIRGDDHLNNTPRQIQLYEALGYELPVFAHLPMILGADKKRLSKRHGATSVMAYKDMGYLPHALLNYLVRLGWANKDQEIFSLDEMIQAFDFSGCSPSAAVFNPEKLDWLNGHYLRESDPRALVGEVREILEKDGIKITDDSLLFEAVQSRFANVKTLQQLAREIRLFFTDVETDPDVIEKNVNEKTLPILKRFFEELEKTQSLDHDVVHGVFEKLMAEFGVGLGKIAGPVRAVITGLKVSPGVYDVIRLFGKEECLKRMQRYL